MFDLATVNDVFVRSTGHGSAAMLMYSDGAGGWAPISSAEVYGRVRALVEVLQGWGVGRGERVALLSENRWEWQIVDFAVLAMGGVDVPLYSTLTAEQVGYMLRDSGARVAVVSSQEMYKKVLAAGELPELEHVVVMDGGSGAGRDAGASAALRSAEDDKAEGDKAEGDKGDDKGDGSASAAGPAGWGESLTELLSRAGELQGADAVFDALVAQAQPEDLCTIIYTSGTTGEPKGVKLTHGNIASNLNYSTGPMGFGPEDSSISFLPLSHVTARHVDYALMCQGVRIAYCPKFDQLPAAMQAVKPTVLVSVPRVYEKIRQAVEAKSAASPVKLKILNWALATGRQHRAETLAGRPPKGLGWKLADKLVFSKIRAAFGGGVKVFISGGAPLGMDSAGWFADAGIRIFEGYGLTETSPVIAVNFPNAHRIGTVGQVLPNVQARFAEDGELEVKGPSIFKGYWNKEQETAESFTPDGWFRTGDIGTIDAERFLSITDRKKELLKTSGGKLIAPQPIENRLKSHTLVSNAAMVGDKHKFACVLISPNLGALEGWAKEQGLATEDRAKLVKDPKVVAMYEGIVGEVNAGLAKFESMKRVCVVPEEWSVEGGELTPSMKLKRRIVAQRYAKEIAEFYIDEASSKA